MSPALGIKTLFSNIISLSRQIADGGKGNIPQESPVKKFARWLGLGVALPPPIPQNSSAEGH